MRCFGIGQQIDEDQSLGELLIGVQKQSGYDKAGISQQRSLSVFSVMDIAPHLYGWGTKARGCGSRRPHSARTTVLLARLNDTHPELHASESSRGFCSGMIVQ
jgi:hypothetical protein